MFRETVTIETGDGRCDASIFRPDSGAGPWPAVLFYMDGVGIRPALFAMGERLASHGYWDTSTFLDFLAAQPDVLQPKVGTAR